jgi:hypothetical protein
MLPWTCGWSDDRLNEEINLHKTLFKILYSILYIFFLIYFFGKCSLKLQITKECVYFLCTFLEHVSRNFSYTKDARSRNQKAPPHWTVSQDQDVYNMVAFLSLKSQLDSSHVLVHSIR